jgi:beta-glucosidase-like glycosyl hydrolase
MVDIGRDPRWGRVAEGFGEDPWLASRLIEAAVIRDDASRGFEPAIN